MSSTKLGGKCDEIIEIGDSDDEIKRDSKVS
jgi:hypothetical protein